MKDPIQVLYVDDDPALLEIGKLFLERSGDFSVTIIESAPVALDLICKEQFDAIISDYQMPGMDGIEFLREVRKQFGEIPFVLFTGKGREEVVIQAINSGVDAYIQKGGEPEAQFAELSHRVRKAVERIQADRARKESEARYRQFFRTTLDSLFITTPEGQYIDFNDAHVGMFGYENREEMSGVSTLSIYAHPEERVAFLKIGEHEGYVKERPILFKKKDGTTFDALLTFVTQRNPDGSIRYFIGTVRDITEQKRVENAMRENEVLLRTLVDTLPDLVWLKDPKGIYLSCNRRFGNFFGAAENDILGKTDYDFMDKERGDVFRHFDDAAIAAGGPTANEEEITFANDGHREVLESIRAPIHTGDGQLTGVLGISRDITERKRAEKALLQANRKLSLLSSITRHDISNQMTVLRGYLVILAKKQTDPAQIEFFHKVAYAVQRVTDMIQFTRQYEEIGASAPVWQDCRILAGTAATAFLPGPITVKNDLTAGLEVYADPLIARVFPNLIENAVQYGGSITTLRLTCEKRHGDLVIVCEDDGEGILPEEKEKIFARGYGRNTGLGLFLSREILSITGITITENGVPGKGARFEIVVPHKAYRGMHHP
ncbi:MAG TPA: PAS domain S-box protein [Methanoregula sp.]|nr:PAS domain S-box protein [Methanoregula sp.]